MHINCTPFAQQWHTNCAPIAHFYFSFKNHALIKFHFYKDINRVHLFIIKHALIGINNVPSLGAKSKSYTLINVHHVKHIIVIETRYMNKH